MSERLVMTRDNRLEIARDTSFQPQNPVIRAVAKVISYLFHPLFVPVYIALFLISVQPFFFDLTTPAKKLFTIIRFVVMYSFFPLVTVLLAKGLGFLDSIFLKTQKDRIIPYIFCGIYYFWMCYVLRNQPEFSKEVVQLTIAIFLASSIGLMVNIYMKVSMHAMSMGLMLTFMFMLGLTQTASYTVYLSVALIVAGLVCTSRFIVSDHTPREIYLGLLVGAVSQLLGIWADGILP